MRQALRVLLLVFSVAAGCAHAQSEVEKLQQQLLQRDTVIHDLLRRVEALERAARTPASTPSQAAAAPVAQAPAAAPSLPPADEEGLRALEQALVRAGGLVLPPRAVEVEASYRYGYDGNRGLAIVSTPAGPQVTDANSRRQRHEAALGLRVGLPWQSQLTLHVPYVRARTTTASGSVGLDHAEQASGLGDVDVQFTRQLGEEGRGRPGLLASLTWKAASGDYRPGLPSPGSGFASVQAALTAVKRQDPLVFFGTLSHTVFRSRSYAGTELEPGASTGIRVGTLLAASPQSSLRIGMDLSRTQRTRANGAALAGTDAVSGVIELGLVSILNRKSSLDLSVGFGVTPDAPKLRVGVALPFRWK